MIWAAFPPLSGKNLQKKQQAKACWKCCKTHTKCPKIFCFYTEKFLHKKSANKSLYFNDLSKRMLATENGMK